MTNLSLKTNSVDPCQTAPGPHCFVEVSKTFEQTRKADNFCCDWRFKGSEIFKFKEDPGLLSCRTERSTVAQC